MLAEGRPRDRFNGTAAARAAGYKTGQQRRAYELLRDPLVKEAIAELLAELREEHATMARQALEELHGAALAQITDVVEFFEAPLLDKEGNCLGTRQAMRLRPREEIPDAAWAAVQEISDDGSGLKVKMAGKAPLLALLLKATGHLLPERGPGVSLGVQVNVGRDAGGGLDEDKVQRARELVGIRKPIDVEGTER